MFDMTLHIMKVNGENQKVISAREIYSELELEEEFAVWMVEHIRTLGLVDNLDFVAWVLPANDAQGILTPAGIYFTLQAAKYLVCFSGGQVAHAYRQLLAHLEKEHFSTSMLEGWLAIADLMGVSPGVALEVAPEGTLPKKIDIESLLRFRLLL